MRNPATKCCVMYMNFLFHRSSIYNRNHAGDVYIGVVANPSIPTIKAPFAKRIGLGEVVGFATK